MMLLHGRLSKRGGDVAEADGATAMHAANAALQHIKLSTHVDAHTLDDIHRALADGSIRLLSVSYLLAAPPDFTSAHP